VLETDRIHDVGSVSGHFLIVLHQHGYGDVPSVDPFAQPGSFALQGTIEDAEGKCHMIFSDSPEHVSAPLETLTSASKPLAEQGRVVLKVLLADSYAWRVDGTNWFAHETPRYLTVPPARAFESWPSERVCVS
jgi:hypothetical protein